QLGLDRQLVALGVVTVDDELPEPLDDLDMKLLRAECSNRLRQRRSLAKVERLKILYDNWPNAPARRRSMTNNKTKPLRSAAWFGTADKNGFMYRSWMKNQGIPEHAFDGRPVIGICNTWSELTPCNAHFRQLAERVKQGVYEGGGLPVEFPVFS